MSLDVVDLYDFYKTPLGKQCQKRISHIIKTLWPDLSHLNVLGLGYPIPYLDDKYTEKAERVSVMMDARQGVIHWPADDRNATALIDYDSIPLADRSVDRILIVHSLEHSDAPYAYMREIWRVLKDNGHILVIAPNRRSIWAQPDDSPFGQGNPYTLAQLSHLLRELQFTPVQSTRGLYIFPSHSRLIQSIFPLFDTIGPLIFTRFSGIVGIEAIKQVYGSVVFKEKKAFNAAIVRSKTARLPG